MSSLQAVSEALVKCGWASAGPGSWTTILTNGAALSVSARFEDPWLRIAAEVPELLEFSWWRLLVHGSALPPHVRLGLACSAHRATSSYLLADAEPRAHEDWSSRVSRISQALILGVSRLHDGRSGDRESGPGAPVPQSVSEALRESGWTAHESEVDLPLDRHGMGVAVRMEARDEELCLWAPLARNLRSRDEECSDAIAAFLLHASYRLRLVRAAVQEEPGRPDSAVGWEARLPLAADPEEIDRALAALTFACRHSMREVVALAAPTLARRYLSQRGARAHTRAPLAEARPSR